MTEPRYVVGIDLGTTHTALAYVDAEDGVARVLDIPQATGRGELDARALLPSFYLVPPEGEGPLPLPWDPQRGFAVGAHARTRGAELPTRVVSSAKSWLCHPTIDRRAAVLPPGAAEIEKISPVEASFRYLEHLAESWDHVIARGEPSLALAQQDVVLTVPASFDATARELTAEAAMAAGLERLTLLEEPQAALYSWLASKGDAWRKELTVGDLLLVVDVGGGTTDFSAIAVVDRGGELGLVRVAVGDHILLGGDNMDLAVAYAVRAKLAKEGRELDAWQAAALTHAARRAKEELLSSERAAVTVVIPGRGAKLLGGAVRCELSREELTAILVDGFFPVVDAGARPVARTRAALTQLGLPYASDAAVTRHLAAFLARQVDATEGLGEFPRAGGLLAPTAILFNGGVMASPQLRERLVSVLSGWLTQAGLPAPRVLSGAELDLAVARGAATYGFVRRGAGVRIRGGTARSYYVGIEGAAPAIPGLEPPIVALCVAPFGMEEGTLATLPDEELGLVVGEAVRFRFFTSSSRRGDAAGASFDVGASVELDELPPIELVLPAEGRREGEVVPVRLSARVTEVGTLKLEAVPTHPRVPDERFEVELNVRTSAELRRRDRSRHDAHCRRVRARRRPRAARDPRDPAADRRGARRAARVVAVVSLRAARRRSDRSARARAGLTLRVRRVRAAARGRDRGSSDHLGEELARLLARRSHGRDPAVGRARRRRPASHLAGRRVGLVPLDRAARLGRRPPRGAARRAARRAHDARVVRRRRARADARGRAPRGADRHAARGAAGSVL